MNPPPSHTNMPLRCAAAAILALWLAGCASSPPRACAGAELPRVVDSLYLGTAKPAGIVSEAEWAGFLADTVTPRFPEGLTAWQAAGQWRGADGMIVKEGSRVLVLVHPDDAASERAVREIVESYKSRFQQEAVLRVTSDGCASF